MSDRTDYYLGAFSFLSSLTIFLNYDAFSSMVTIIVPYLIIALSISLLNLVLKLFKSASNHHFLFVYIFLFFSGGNFFLQPNIDDRLLAVLPVVSLTQSFGLIIFFDLAGNILSRSSIREMRIVGLVNKVILPIFCLFFVKPSLVPVAILLIAISLSLINSLKRLLLSFFFISLVCYCFTLLGNTMFLFRPNLPDLFSDTMLSGICFASFFLYLSLSWKVEKFDWLIPAYLLLMLFFQFFHFYGAESWFVDPLRLLIVMRLFSFFANSYFVDSPKNNNLLRMIPLIVFVLYLVDTGFEIIFDTGILLKLLLLLVFVCFLVLAYLSHFQTQVWLGSEILPASSQIRVSGFRIFSTNSSLLLSFFLLFASFNPLLIVESLGQIKQAKNSVGISISEEDFKELVEIRRLVKGSGVKDTAVGLSNFLCANNEDIEVQEDFASCDSRTFVLSGIIGLRSPLEGGLFPIWISKELKTSYIKSAVGYQISLRSWPLLVNWLSSYSDPVKSQVDIFFFLLDKYGTSNPVAYHAQKIYLGKRFSLYSFTLDKT